MRNNILSTSYSPLKLSALKIEKNSKISFPPIQQGTNDLSKHQLIVRQMNYLSSMCLDSTYIKENVHSIQKKWAFFLCHGRDGTDLSRCAHIDPYQN